MILSIFLLLFCGVSLLIGSLMLRSHRRLQRVGIKTQAKVVGCEEVVSSGGSDGPSTSYYPTLEFKASNGETITARSNSSKRKKEIARMEKEQAHIEIIYDPSKPTEFSVNSRFFVIVPFVLCIVGLVGVTVGVFGLLGIIDMPEG